MSEYTAIVKHDGEWWIGWIEEVPGVNCQERTREDLIGHCESRWLRHWKPTVTTRGPQRARSSRRFASRYETPRIRALAHRTWLCPLTGRSTPFLVHQHCRSASLRRPSPC